MDPVGKYYFYTFHICIISSLDICVESLKSLPIVVTEGVVKIDPAGIAGRKGTLSFTILFIFYREVARVSNSAE